MGDGMSFLEAFKLAIKGFWTSPRKIVVCILDKRGNTVSDITEATDEQILEIVKKAREV